VAKRTVPFVRSFGIEDSFLLFDANIGLGMRGVEDILMLESKLKEVHYED
jgi:hypothetical protein